MAIRHLCVCAALFTATGHPAQAVPSVEPRELSSIEERERTKIFVLGSPHLRELREDFNPESVKPLIARLQSFSPDAIAVEALSPAVIRSMQARGGVFEHVLANFAGKTLRFGEQARAALGLSYEEVSARTSGLMQKAEKGEAYDHRTLALHFLALNDVPSAVLQWSYLEAAARGEREGFPAEIAEFLNARLTSPNEIYALAVPLARRLGQVRLTSIDDHSDKDLYVAIMDELNAEMQKNPLLAEAKSAQIFKDGRKILETSNRNGDLTAAYRFHNSPAYARADVETQWDVFMKTRLKSGADRTRLALWDVRNLLIAAHIRRLTAQHPGGRVLVIIGASHKAFLDALLNQAMDVRLVPAETVLGTEH